MTNPDPTLPKRISIGWLACEGMALGALLVPLAVAVDRFGCALRQFVITALSIVPGGAIGFIIAYWIGCRRA
ncbi:MAG: hypothetical protein WCC81_13415 [Pseudolabrys sp.]|jgi:hypothetical protein